MCFFFFFNDPAATGIYTYCHTLSLHDALPICLSREKWLFENLLDELSGHAQALSQCAAALAEVDALASLAEHALANDWAAANLSENNEIIIEAGDRKSTRLNSSH